MVQDSDAANYVIQNRPPAVTILGQFKTDGSTAIPEGGSTAERTVVFKSILSDPYVDQVKLQIELCKVTEAFTGTPTMESDLVFPDSEIAITQEGLAYSSYKWRYRAVDANGNKTPWYDFGAPDNTDFIVLEKTITVTAPRSDFIMKKVGTSCPIMWTSSNVGPYVNIGFKGNDTAIASNVANHNGGGYLWTVTMGGGPIYVTDASDPSVYDYSDPVITYFIGVREVNQYKSDGVTVIPGGGTADGGTVVFKGKIDDPGPVGDVGKLQVEICKVNEVFTGIPTSESNWAGRNQVVTITQEGLADGSYNWRYNCLDADGISFGWGDFGTSDDIDFIVGE